MMLTIDPGSPEGDRTETIVVSRVITFVVPAIPVAQPRQRHRIVTTAGRSFATNYTPAKSPVNDFKASVRMAAWQAYSGPPLEGPLSVQIIAVFPRPASKRWKNKPMLRFPKLSKPDADNIAKANLDALNGLLFVDDAQVARLLVEKWLASGDEQPHVEISVGSLETE